MRVLTNIEVHSECRCFKIRRPVWLCWYACAFVPILFIKNKRVTSNKLSFSMVYGLWSLFGCQVNTAIGWVIHWVWNQCTTGCLQTVVLKSVRLLVVVGPGGRPDHDKQHCYHHAPQVKPEAATAVVELLMMGRKTPETCWAVNKCQDNKLKNFCIRLVIYLN
jgi:hypothetical protein